MSSLKGQAAAVFSLTRLAAICSLVIILAAPALAAPHRSAPVPLLTATVAAGVVADVSLGNNQVELDFPNSLIFSLDLTGAEDVVRVILEYGTEQLACGSVTGKAFPEYESGTAGRVSWTWEMMQSGSQPPGAQVWWRWHLVDASGAVRVTDTQTITWLDDRHAWETLSRDGVSLHWYRGSDAFAEDLLQAALTALDELAVTPGLHFDGDVDLYIYSDTEALQEAVLYEPGWTGGLAYPEHSIVLIGVAPDQLDWGRHTVAHELTHVLVGHYTFSCLGYVPTWLNEGLAVYGEGGPDSAWSAQLQRAIVADALIPVLSLNGGFSEDPAQADLSYVQSYSLVNFLIETRGAAAMLDMLGRLRDGATVEAALLAAYGFGLEDLERDWRASIGAQPLNQVNATSTPVPSATIVPTIVPLDGIPAGPTVAPTRVRPAATATQPTRGRLVRPEVGVATGAGLLLIGAVVLCPSLIFLGFGAVAFWQLRRRR